MALAIFLMMVAIYRDVQVDGESIADRAELHRRQERGDQERQQLFKEVDELRLEIREMKSK